MLSQLITGDKEFFKPAQNQDPMARMFSKNPICMFVHIFIKYLRIQICKLISLLTYNVHVSVKLIVTSL